MHFEIFGDDISGNCLKVKWTADVLKLPYKWVQTSPLKRETRTEEFMAINPAGQVPAVRFEDGRTLAQSNAIILYLAEVAGSDLLPADPFTRAQLNSWLFWEQYNHEPTIAVRRFKKALMGLPDEEIDPNLLTYGNEALSLLEKNFTYSDWALKEGMTLADISLVAYTRMAGDGGFDLAAYPNLTRWIARVEQALGLDPYPGYTAL